MRFHYDQEFLEDGYAIELLSIGMVADDDEGRELYLINRDAHLPDIARHDWLMANVVPHLPLTDTGVFSGPRLEWDRNHRDWPNVQPRTVIRDRVRAFIEQYGTNRADHELWGWYADYDHVALCQLFGPSVDLPSSIPMFTHDLRQSTGKANIALPKQACGTVHHALADARWVRDSHHYLMAMFAPVKPIILEEGQVARLQQLMDLQTLPDTWGELSSETRAEIRRLTRGTPFWRVLDEACGIPTT